MILFKSSGGKYERVFMRERFKGFTLAEVLITLGIIGIVAAMTIPTLQANYQKQEYITKLKKAYTTFNQALIQISADMGCPGDLKCTGLFVGYSYEPESIAPPGFTKFSIEIRKYFKILKLCKGYSIAPLAERGCFSDSVGLNYEGTGTRVTFDHAGVTRFITTDGVAYNIYTNTDCSSNISSNFSKHLTQVCGTLSIDVNGPQKGPNNFGRDIFRFYISNGKGPMLYPLGGKDDTGYWKDINGCVNNSNTVSGYSCAAKIMEEGWQMNY